MLLYLSWFRKFAKFCMPIQRCFLHVSKISDIVMMDFLRIINRCEPPGILYYSILSSLMPHLFRKCFLHQSSVNRFHFTVMYIQLLRRGLFSMSQQSIHSSSVSAIRITLIAVYVCVRLLLKRLPADRHTSIQSRKSPDWLCCSSIKQLIDVAFIVLLQHAGAVVAVCRLL